MSDPYIDESSMKPLSKNMSYAAIYDRNWTDEYESLRAMRQKLQSQFDEMQRAEQRRRQPRKKKNFDPLPVEVQEEMVKEIKSSAMWAEVERLEAEIKREKKDREKLLETFAPHVEMKPDKGRMCRLKTSSSCTYASQGYGAMKYAKGILEPLLDMLVAHGFEAYIRQTNYHRGTGRFAVDHCDYELWANCPPWMFDAACRQLSLADAVASMKRRCINPLVYNPFLPESCRL